MDCITNVNWWKAAGIRAIRSFFQNLLISLPVGVSIEQMGWTGAIGLAAGAAVLSLVTSLAGLPEVCEEPVEGKHAKED